MFNIFFSSIASTIILIGYGSLFNKILFKKDVNKSNLSYVGLLGFVLIGFIAVFINFFFPINLFVGNISLIVSFILFIIYYLNFKKKIKLFSSIIFISITTCLLVILSNVNRPDAGLYHLPYISFLQENKIALGITNIHYRFGYISIFQYISSMYNNSFFTEEFITIPLASLFSFFIAYLISEFKKNLNNNNEFNKIILFLIFIFSLYAFNRYSNYGNDAPASIYFFILIISLLKITNFNTINSKTYFKILILIIFLIALKTTMAITFIVPLILFFVNKNKIEIIRHKNILICSILFFLWLVKNLLVSGCFVFPLKITCIEKLDYYNKQTTLIASEEAEAWSKGYPNDKRNINYKDYISNFNWTKTWLDNHFKKILEKILPLILLILLFFWKNIFKINFFKRDKKNIYIIIFLIYCCTIWFLKFPVYRFGLAFISSLIIIGLVFLFQDDSKKYNKKFYQTIIFIGVILFYSKNLDRIFKNHGNYYESYPWPKIYSFKNNEKNIKKVFLKIYDKEGNFLYYYSGHENCMFSASPCSPFINENLKLEKFSTYKKYMLEKN
jgi:hypothetical protein